MSEVMENRKHPPKAAGYLGLGWWRRISGEEAPGGGLGLCGLIVPLAVLPVPREEFVEPALRRPGDAVEDVGEPGRKHPPKAAGYLGLSLVAAHFR